MPPAVPLTSLVSSFPGLVSAFRFDGAGVARAVAAGAPLEPGEEPGWLWLHFNIADKRAAQWVAEAAAFPPAARAVLAGHHEHQQLYRMDGCVCGAVTDLVRNLDKVLDQTAFLNFAMTDRVVVTARRQSLQAVEAVRALALAGKRIATPAALIEAIVGEIAAGIDRLLDALSREVDRAEDRMLIEAAAEERQRVGHVRRTGVHLHRQLTGMRTLFARFETGDVEDEAPLDPAIALDTDRLVQRLDGLDQEVVSLQERARLIQEEIGARLSEESARSLNVVAILSAVFLPATLVTGIFGMNTAALPFTETPGGSFWAIALVAGAAGLAWWLLRRAGVTRR